MSVQLNWLGQGGYWIRCGETAVCLDPYLSFSCEEHGGHTRIAPPPLDPASIRADLFVFSHDHMDHLDEGTLRRIDLRHNRFAGPDSCLNHLRRLGVPEENLLRLPRGGRLAVGDIELFGVHAEHTEDSIGLIVRGHGQTVYFTADTLWSDLLITDARPFSPDVLVTCINGRWGNMDHRQAADLARALKVHLSIPTHYGMFAENTADPADFVHEMQEENVLLLTMYKPVVLPDFHQEEK